MDDLLALHRRALLDLDAVVGRVTEGDLRRQTPCAAWDVSELLAHEVGQHLGFARAVRDGAAPASAYVPVAFDAEGWRASVEELVAAFASSSDGTEVVQVELHPTQPLPVRALVGAQLLDAVVHTWDLARALGVDHRPDDVVVTRVLRMAERIPDGPERGDDGAAFGPVSGSAMPGGGDDWERLLGLLGRDPAWVPADPLS